MQSQLFIQSIKKIISLFKNPYKTEIIFCPERKRKRKLLASCHIHIQYIQTIAQSTYFRESENF